MSNLPKKAGVCLKAQHAEQIMAEKPPVGWFEVHAENYLGNGGKPLNTLSWIRDNYPISIHGVGLSIGSSNGLNTEHLRRVSDLVKRFQPESFSEHLAWSSHGQNFYSDLLPVPYNKETEDTICRHIDQVQNSMGRQMLLENPSNYLSLHTSTISESELISNIVKRTGCGLLLDVNNVYISAKNMGYSAEDYIESLPLSAVHEMHLAGHATDDSVPEEILLIDSHDRCVSDDVWSLYEFTVQRCGKTATLIEWDSQLPTWNELFDEMKKAELRLSQTDENTYAVA